MKSHAMVKVNLKTSGDLNVATVQIPPFQTALPRVLRWGGRTFYRRDKSVLDLTGTPTYHEVFAFDVLNQGGGRD